MNQYETLQTTILGVQTVTLFFTLIAAYNIGRKQNEINENLVKLEFFPSIEVIFDLEEKRIRIYNKGRQNLYLWGTELNNNGRVMETQPRLVSIGGHYYLNAKKLLPEDVEGLDQNQRHEEILELYIESEDGKKYKVKTAFIFKKIHERIVIDSQTYPLVDVKRF